MIKLFFNRRIGAVVNNALPQRSAFFQRKFSAEKKPAFSVLKSRYDYLAPDTSEIRLLLTEKHSKNASMCHCKLNPMETTSAVRHKTIEEFWYITKGIGEIWIKTSEEEFIYQLQPGVSIKIPPMAEFQFRNTSDKENLEIVITSVPAWPGYAEAEPAKGIWKESGIKPANSLI